jgi:hypothetical protein
MKLLAPQSGNVDAAHDGLVRERQPVDELHQQLRRSVIHRTGQTDPIGELDRGAFIQCLLRAAQLLRARLGSERSDPVLI